MATVMTAREHTLDKGKVHHQWDKSIPPAIEMESGDTVHCGPAKAGHHRCGPHTSG